MNGHLTQVSDRVADRHLSYRLDAEGKILQRNELIGSQSSKTQYYYYLNGTGIGDAGGFGPSNTDYAAVLASHLPNPPQSGCLRTSKAIAQVAAQVGSADFDYNYTPINDRYSATTPGTYTIQQGQQASSVEQTLRNVALAVWGDASLWYLLAEANGLTSGSSLEVGQTLVVPNVVTNTQNNASTFKVYNPGELIGNTAPTLPEPPPPPQPEEDRFFKFLAVVFVVAVTIFVGIVATEFLYSAVLGAAVGNAAGQVMAKALGLREHFSWHEVGTAALTAGLTYDVRVGNAYTTALLRDVIAQGVRVARNPEEKFSWGELAAAPVNAWIDLNAGSTSNAISVEGATREGFTRDLTSELAKGAINVLASHRGKIDWSNVAAVALGTAIGNAVGADVKFGRDRAGGRQTAMPRNEYAVTADREDAELGTAVRTNALASKIAEAQGRDYTSPYEPLAANGPAAMSLLLRPRGQVATESSGPADGAGFQADMAQRRAEDPFVGPVRARQPNVDIQFGSRANSSALTDYSRSVISDVANQAGVSSLKISSTARSPEDQARVMYENLMAGTASEYKAPGRAIFESARDAGLSAEQTKALMASQIRDFLDQGKFVSSHVGDPSVRNVFDVAPSSVSNRAAFEAAARANPSVTKFLSTQNNDPAFHFEIVQPKPPN
jgi:hypothetical protein